MSAAGRGTFTGSAVTDGSSSATGDNIGGYLKFNPSTTDVTVAVALSHSSMAQAQQFFNNEFSDFNFAAASQRLKDAWNAKLGRIDVQKADQLTKQMLYTGLYSVYANIINATDGSSYASYAAAYGSPVLTILRTLTKEGFRNENHKSHRRVYSGHFVDCLNNPVHRIPAWNFRPAN
jgi:hypothetical protein